jgi:hypothetical protein
MLLWYVLHMVYSGRHRNRLAFYAVLLLLNEEIYESYRRQFRKWIADAEDVRGDRLSMRALEVVEKTANALGNDGSILLAHQLILDAKQHPVGEITTAAEYRAEFERLAAHVQTQDETIARLYAHRQARDETIASLQGKAVGYDWLESALRDHPDLAAALYDRLGGKAST